MTPEKTYQSIIEMIKAYDAATDNNVLPGIVKDPFTWAKNPYFPFYANAAEMLIDALAAMDKHTTSAGVIAAVKRICKAAEKMSNPALKGVFPDRGMYAICDGHRFIRLKDDIDSLPHVDLNKCRPVDLAGCTPKEADLTETVNLPTVADVKAYIAKCKAIAGRDWHYTYSYDLGGVFVNPQYLLDMLQALPGCEAKRTNNPKAPIMFTAENGEGLLLPVNPKTARVAA